MTGLLSGLLARGIDPVPLLERAGVDARVLSDRALRVPISAYVALYNAVVEALDDEAFGLFARPLRRGAFEFMVRGALGSGDVSQALGRMGRFLDLVLPELAVEANGDRIRIRERIPLRRAESRVFAYEWLLRVLHGVACWLAARPIALVDVRFPFPRPGHAADYPLIYTEHAAFGGLDLVATLGPGSASLPVRRTHADVAAFLEGAPGKISLLYRRDRALARDVRAALAGSLASSLQDIARELGLSTRTLHRRLEEEGTSFRRIKDGVRRELALERLRGGAQSVAEVAHALGYSEPSAFFRAFRGWTGEAPSTHRKRHASGKIS